VCFSLILSICCLGAAFVAETQTQAGVVLTVSEVRETQDVCEHTARVQIVDKAGRGVSELQLNGEPLNLVGSSNHVVDLVFKGSSRVICDVVWAGQRQRFLAKSGGRYLIALTEASEKETPAEPRAKTEAGRKAPVGRSPETMRLRLELLDVATDKWAEAERKQKSLQESIERLQQRLKEEASKHKRFVTLQQSLRADTDERKLKSKGSLMSELTVEVADCEKRIADFTRDLKSRNQDLEKAGERCVSAKSAVNDLLNGIETNK
jgi:hypothetical protein